MLGVHSLHPFPGRFLFGQQLLGEQSEPRTLGGQGAFGRRKSALRNASGFWPFKDAASNFYCQWGRESGYERRLDVSAVWRHWLTIAGYGHNTFGGCRGR